jgi:hypothetical protein
MIWEHQRSVLLWYATAPRTLTDLPEQKRKVASETTSITSRRFTRSMTTDAPRRVVFDTTELLESILVHLPPKNLFGALRVSKQFQTVITGSVSIQEKMFLRIRKRPGKFWLLKEARTKPHYVEEMILSPQRGSNRIVEFNPFLELPCQIPRLGAWNSLSEYVELTIGKSVTLSML